MAKTRKKVQAKRKAPAKTESQDQKAAKAESQAKKRDGKKEGRRQEGRTRRRGRRRNSPSATTARKTSTPGLRSYSAYRDLGIAPATGGMVQAHVIRMLPPFEPEEGRHRIITTSISRWSMCSRAGYQSEFEGEGVHTFHAGSCWIQPPKIKHTVLGYSDDCELLEIVLPAEFETVMLEE